MQFFSIWLFFLFAIIFLQGIIVFYRLQPRILPFFSNCTFWQWLTLLSNTVLQTTFLYFHADVSQSQSSRNCIQYSNNVSSPSKNPAIRIRDNAVLINFYLQFFKFILMISGDIEVTPGPITDNILDIVNLNIRIIRHKISHLIL